MTHKEFKTSVNRLNEILFDVDVRPVYVGYIFPDKKAPQLMQSKKHKAIVNSSTGKLLSIVSKNYRITTNREALEMGKEVFVQLFPGYSKDKLTLFKVIAPKSLTSVNFDITHPEVFLNIREQENWLPFLRITNSFNRRQALVLEIGFVHKLWANSVLFDPKNIDLQFSCISNKPIRLTDKTDEIYAFSEKFRDWCDLLKSYPLSMESFFPLLCMILCINLEAPAPKQFRHKKETLNKIHTWVKHQIRNYQEILGMNAYTAFILSTDLVSHNSQYNVLPGYYVNIRSYFTRPTTWMVKFTRNIRQNDFSLEEYLSSTIQKINAIHKPD